MDTLKVSAQSNPNAVAGHLAAALRGARGCEVTVIGAGAVNQAMKAVAIARQLLREEGIDAVCAPSFVHVDVDGAERTALSLVVEHRGPDAGTGADVVVDLTETARDAASPAHDVGIGSGSF